MTTPDTTPVPPLNLHEYEAAARALLPPMVWDYVAGGSGDEVTLRANCAAFAWNVYRPTSPASTRPRRDAGRQERLPVPEPDAATG